jgi:phosphoenolpyruvate-protein kinase (PTS system EI component)
LAKDSTKQLFDKDYNWLDVLLSGLMKAKIRNEMIEEVPFSTASADIINEVLMLEDQSLQHRFHDLLDIHRSAGPQTLTHQAHLLGIPEAFESHDVCSNEIESCWGSHEVHHLGE